MRKFVFIICFLAMSFFTSCVSTPVEEKEDVIENLQENDLDKKDLIEDIEENAAEDIEDKLKEVEKINEEESVLENLSEEKEDVIENLQENDLDKKDLIENIEENTEENIEGKLKEVEKINEEEPVLENLSEEKEVEETENLQENDLDEKVLIENIEENAEEDIEGELKEVEKINEEEPVLENLSEEKEDEETENLQENDLDEKVLIENIEANTEYNIEGELKEVEKINAEEPILENLSEEKEVEEIENLQENDLETKEAIIPISRKVEMDCRQYLDIKYPGFGWTYLGEVYPDGSIKEENLLSYFGRRRNTSDTLFTLRSTESGTTILHFYKQDVLTASFIDDFLEVEITSEIGQIGSRVSPPLYEDVVPQNQFTIPQPIFAENIEMSPVETITNITESNTISDSKPMPIVQREETNKKVDKEDIEVQNKKQNDVNVNMSNEKKIIESNETRFAEIFIPQKKEEKITVENKDLPLKSDISNNAFPKKASVTTVEENKKENLQETELSQNINSLENENISKYIPTDENLSNKKEENFDANLSLLEEAQNEFYEENYSKAAELIEIFLAQSASKIDAALYLKGQIFEANSDIQNIRTALSAYKKILKEYPLSPFWQQAKNRHTYLNRFYFDIR